MTGLPEKAQNEDGDDKRCQRHGVADGVSDPHRAQEFTVRDILHTAHTHISIQVQNMNTNKLISKE